MITDEIGCSKAPRGSYWNYVQEINVDVPDSSLERTFFESWKPYKLLQKNQDKFY